MFVRIKRIKGKEYAYLVNNEWTDRGPRQKTVAYLGRAISIPNGKVDEGLLKLPENVDEMEYKEIVEHAIRENLKAAGFREEDKELVLEEEGIKYLPEKRDFLKNKRRVCLKLNEGIMCNFTLEKLLQFERTGEDRRDILLFAEAIVGSGIKLTKEIFVKLFTKLPKPEMEVQRLDEFEY
ncbi:hypothetical protein D6764_03265 [Candidatus Woesearchaeota archaeon]|nr:MAG: hypothetical protein D6764_03265 [Candidatus Woesearchaeota archaeon]